MASIEKQIQLKNGPMKMNQNFLKPKPFTCTSVIINTLSRPSINSIQFTIPAVSQTKYLGVIFDNKLNFKAHYHYFQQKCEKNTSLLKVLAKMH